MKKIVGMLIIVFAVSCSQRDLKRENEELLQLTKELTETVQALQAKAEQSLAEAVAAQAEAEMQAELAREMQMRALEQAADAARHAKMLEEKLKSCK